MCREKSKNKKKMRKVTINSRKTSKKDATTCIQGDMGHKTPSDEGQLDSLIANIIVSVILDWRRPTW